MTSKNRAGLISKLQGLLKKNFKPAPASPGRPLLEHVLYGALLEEAPVDLADEGYAKCEQEFFDWNEVRVTSVTELAEVLAHLPAPTSTAVRLKRCLQGIFEAFYTFDIDHLKKENLGKAVAKFETMAGVTPFVLSHVVQHGLGGHAIPVNMSAMRIMSLVGIVTPQEARTGKIPGLERAIPKNKAIEFASTLHQAAIHFAADPFDKLVQDIILAANPEAELPTVESEASRKSAQRKSARRKAGELAQGSSKSSPTAASAKPSPAGSSPKSAPAGKKAAGLPAAAVGKPAKPTAEKSAKPMAEKSAKTAAGKAEKSAAVKPPKETLTKSPKQTPAKPGIKIKIDEGTATATPAPKTKPVKGGAAPVAGTKSKSPTTKAGDRETVGPAVQATDQPQIATAKLKGGAAAKLEVAKPTPKVKESQPAKGTNHPGKKTAPAKEAAEEKGKAKPTPPELPDGGNQKLTKRKPR
jgi:endonuclease III